MPKNRPAPISQKEVEDIVPDAAGHRKPRHKVEFVVGEFVRVKEGPFTDFNGTVEEVNYEKSKVRVSVMIFGRATLSNSVQPGREDLSLRSKDPEYVNCALSGSGARP